jgi:type II secretory pathway predicted ATPase ExeA
MNTKLLLLCCCATLAFAISGCGKKAGGVNTGKLESSFATAEPTAKDQATKVVNALKAEDYNTALAGLRGLAQQASLTPDQKAAVQDVTEQVQKQLDAMLKKATEGTQKAVEDAKKSLPKSP